MAKDSKSNEVEVQKTPNQSVAAGTASVDANLQAAKAPVAKSTTPGAPVAADIGGVEYGQQTDLKNEKQAIVNPALDTLSVSIPYAMDEETGALLAHHFEPGQSYSVSAELLEVKSTDGVHYLVEADKK